MAIKLRTLASSVPMPAAMASSIKKCMLSALKANAEISKYLSTLVWRYPIKFKTTAIAPKPSATMFINISSLKFKVERLTKGFVFTGIFALLIPNYQLIFDCIFRY